MSHEQYTIHLAKMCHNNRKMHVICIEIEWKKETLFLSRCGSLV